MGKNTPEDPVMQAIRERLEASGMTYQTLGEKMGYPAASARQSVSQLLKGGDPRIGTLRRFAKAMGLSVSRLVRD